MSSSFFGVGVGRRVVTCTLFAASAATLIACMATVRGERAQTGECPAGEVCSAQTQAGLNFVGHAFWDDSQSLLLGPVLVGGTFELGITTMDGGPLPEFAFEADDGQVFAVERGAGKFGPTDRYGDPFYHVDAHLTLTGVGPGTTHIRVTDAATGELFDRIAIEAYEVEDISITNMEDPDRDYVIAGCEELLAVRLVAKAGTRELRAFDQSVRLRAEGTVQAEPAFWDCFSYEPPQGKATVDVEIEAAGQTFSKALEVRTLLELELDACPARKRRD